MGKSYITFLLTYTFQLMVKGKISETAKRKMKKNEAIPDGKSFFVSKNLLDRLSLIHIQSMFLDIPDNRIW